MGNMTEVGYGLWYYNIDEDSSGWYNVQSYTTATPSWTDVEGYDPVWVSRKTPVYADEDATITGTWDFSGVVDLTGTPKINGTAITATAAEINLIDGVTAGQAADSKVLIVDANSDLDFTAGTTGDVTVHDIECQGIQKNTSGETITGSGAVALTTQLSQIDSSGGVLALTLADGTAGQFKVIYMKTAGNAATVTPSNFENGTSITFDAVGETVFLFMTLQGWVILGYYGATINA